MTRLFRSKYETDAVYHAWAIAGLIVLGVVGRALMIAMYEPMAYGDTGTYLRLADQIRTWDFSAFDGSRTPGYPLFLMLLGKSPEAVWLAQQILGISTSLLLYAVAWHLTRNQLISFAVAAIHALTLNTLFFEAALLTESVATWLLMLATAIFVRALKKHEVGIMQGTLLGVVCALVALTHPLFVFVGPLLALLAVFFLDFRRAAKFCAAILVVWLIPVGAWVGFNKLQVDYLGLTSFMGYNLTNHSGRFMELAPPGEVRDIYLRYRNEKIQETGTHSMTIFEAEDELRASTGLSRPELSKELSAISLRLFADHPSLYLRSVAEQWYSYWAVPNYWRLQKVSPQSLQSPLQGVWKLEQLGLRAANAFFVLSGPVLIWLFFGSRRENGHTYGLGLALYSLVLGASVVQALVEFGQTRYSITTQPIVVLMVGATALWLWRHFRKPRDSRKAMPVASA